MTSPNHRAIREVIRVLDDSEMTLNDFLITILTHPIYKDHATTTSITQGVVPILQTFLETTETREAVIEWANKITLQEKYRPQMLLLMQKESGFQFSATTMTEEALSLCQRVHVLFP